jgi:hypothetical protein
MADEADTPAEAGVGETAVEDGGGTAAETLDAKTARRLAEKDAYIAKLQSERDRALNEGTRNSQLLEQLIKGQQAPAKDGGSQNDSAAADARVEALVEEMAAAFREDESKGSRKSLELMNSYAMDVERRAKESLDLTKKELAELVATEVAKLRETLEDRDPEYVQLADTVKGLTEELGLDPKKDRALLLKLARREAKPSRPDRHELPGGGGAGRGGRGGDEVAIGAAEESYLTDGLGGGKLTKAEKEFLASRK